ncbi:MAG: MarC family protein [Rhodospirillaceae bacterium]
MTIAAAAITLFLLLDALGNAPIFLTILGTLPVARRRTALLRELGFAFAILVVFLLFGQVILGALGISSPALSVAGGVVLFVVALKMLFPNVQAPLVSTEGGDAWFVPMAVPLIAGPSSMAWVMLLATQHPDRMVDWFLAVVIAVGASGVVLLIANRLRDHVSDQVLRVVERLVGMILVVIAVQMLMDGIGEFLMSLEAP